MKEEDVVVAWNFADHASNTGLNTQHFAWNM